MKDVDGGAERHAWSSQSCGKNVAVEDVGRGVWGLID